MNELKKETTKEVTRYVTAGLGLVAGLAWNDAIKAAIEVAFPLEKNSVTAKFIYAVIITLVVVFVSTYFINVLKSKDEDNK